MDSFKVPLKIKQYATFRKSATWKNVATGIPFDLAGCTARMHVRPEVKSSTVLVELTTENGGIVLGGSAGTVALFLSDEATALFSWSSAVYDLKIYFPNGDSHRLMYGPVTVSPGVTRV